MSEILKTVYMMMSKYHSKGGASNEEQIARLKKIIPDKEEQRFILAHILSMKMLPMQGIDTSSFLLGILFSCELKKALKESRENKVVPIQDSQQDPYDFTE